MNSNLEDGNMSKGIIKDIDVEEETDDFAIAFCRSIPEDCVKLSLDIIEAGMDSIMDDGIFKEIPVLATLMSVFHVGHSVVER